MGVVDELSVLARDHLENPRNRASLSTAPGHVVSGEAGSAASGAFLRFHLRVVAARIAAVRYEVIGPPELLATASWFAESLTGLDAAPAAVPPGMEAARALSLPRAAHGVALLVEDAVRDALRHAR